MTNVFGVFNILSRLLLSLLLTVPKRIERYYNQPSEDQMHITIDLHVEKQLEIGSGNIKGNRFAKLMSGFVPGNSNRYLLQTPRCRLNHGRIRKNKGDLQS